MPYTETSRRVTVENVEWADYILTMTDAHKHTLLHLFPQASQKIYTLKGFIDPVADENVQDPYGGNLETYTQTFENYRDLWMISNGSLEGTSSMRRIEQKNAVQFFHITYRERWSSIFPKANRLMTRASQP